MLERLNDPDWGRAFLEANPVDCDAFPPTTINREDVVEIIAIAEPPPELRYGDWLGVFRLKDGGFASIKVSSNYEGEWFGCGGLVLGKSVEEVTSNLTDWDRCQLDLPRVEYEE